MVRAILPLESLQGLMLGGLLVRATGKVEMVTPIGASPVRYAVIHRNDGYGCRNSWSARISGLEEY